MKTTDKGLSMIIRKIMLFNQTSATKHEFLKEKNITQVRGFLNTKNLYRGGTQWKRKNG